MRRLYTTSPKIPKAYWSVIPRVRGRTATTNKLWLDRLNKVPDNANFTPHKVLQKRMSDSFRKEWLCFGSDKDIWEDYVNPHGKVRIGRILEDLDALAGSIAYTHCDDNHDDTPPLTIVTASVERISMLKGIPPKKDVCISGFVSYVGTSSMEISIKMTCPNDDNSEDVLLSASFTMVAKDPITKKSTPINQLILETDEERKLFQVGEQRKMKKLEHIGLDKIPPTPEEMILVHDLYKETMQYLDPGFHTKKPDNVVYIKDTTQRNLIICMPQDRNIHNNIFGGFLMRQAYELAYATGSLFMGGQPQFLSLDELVFKKPVPIGCYLSFLSNVVYTKDDIFVVAVRADMIDATKPKIQAIENSNTFSFRFRGDGKMKVLPRSYGQSIKYIQGKRSVEME